MNKTLGIVITDGVGYRNFILSNFLENAVAKFDKVIIYSGLPLTAYSQLTKYQNLELKEIPYFTENKLNWFLRKLKEVAHLRQFKSFYGINDNLKNSYPKKNTLSAILVKIIYGITYLFHSEKNIIWFEKLQYYYLNFNKKTKQTSDLFKHDNPSHLFFTHQRPPYVAPVLKAAHITKISTSVFIFSWDNLASKGRMLGAFNYYFVWSELMQKELLYFYSNIKKEAIAIVGTPQFEPYVMDKYFMSKEDFYQKFNLDETKKIICYSCADASIGENDELHIEAVLNFIKSQRKNNLQLLVRTSPAEDGKRFEKLKNKYPEIKWNVPKWEQLRENHAEQWSQRVPTAEDVADLKAILMYADVNVNMLSTMSLDFMLFNKPVVNTVFGNAKNGYYNDQRFLNYNHYKTVVDSGAVSIAMNSTELANYLQEAIQFPNKRKDEREKLIKMQVGKPLEGTSARIINDILNLL